jgi:hypothetical protein
VGRASTLFDELTALGYAGSYSSFTRALRMRRLRPHCEPCAASRGRDAGMLFIGPQAATPAAVANAVARTRSSPSWTWAGGRANSVLSLGGRAWQVTYIDWKMLVPVPALRSGGHQRVSPAARRVTRLVNETRLETPLQ